MARLAPGLNFLAGSKLPGTRQLMGDTGAVRRVVQVVATLLGVASAKLVRRKDRNWSIAA